MIRNRALFILSGIMFAVASVKIGMCADINALKNSATLERLLKQTGVYNTSSTGKTPELRGPLLSVRECVAVCRFGIGYSQAACEREIVRIIGSAELLRDDVLDMRPQLAVLLAQLAIFAVLISATPHEVACAVSIRD